MALPMNIEQSILLIESQATADLQTAHSVKDVESIKVKYLGKKGLVQSLMDSLRSCEASDRPRLGKSINDLKDSIVKQMEQALLGFEERELEKKLSEETLDVTMPGRRRFVGRKHILMQVMDEALSILSSMGFAVQLGPHIENDYYNFEALNFSKDHPARDMHDTFYVTSDLLLRTHTSNTQIRVMEHYKPPIRIAAPGLCFRNEDVSARSHILFHQIEGLLH